MPIDEWSLRERENHVFLYITTSIGGHDVFCPRMCMCIDVHARDRCGDATNDAIN
jgi:hypothetical protein